MLEGTRIQMWTTDCLRERVVGGGKWEGLRNKVNFERF